ncbi:MAG: addiction module toxin, HicA family [Chloroflexi bacterium]|nr:addiction module toxin, HicA family [Chloroflexota bacterium]MYE40178.1 addiction module toxin, HicA family [Chloroflexota bacterium]
MGRDPRRGAPAYPGSIEYGPRNHARRGNIYSHRAGRCLSGRRMPGCHYMSSDRINYSRLRSLTTRQLIKALSKDGFAYIKSTGSHRHYKHPDGRLVIVPYNRSGDTHPIKTLRSIIEGQALWTTDDLRRLGLL